MVVGASGEGNAGYKAGNVIVSDLGLSAITVFEKISVFSAEISLWPLFIGGAAFMLLWFGSYKSLAKVFAGFVALMSIFCIVTAAMIKPDFIALVKCILVPKLTENNKYIALGLIGTTIPTYNFFLYSSLIR